MCRRATGVLLLFAMLASCATDDAPDGGLPTGVTASPDGTGYCCEPHRYMSCTGFDRGGYALTPTTCFGRLSDVSWTPTTREFVDAHGCPTLDSSTATSCIAFDLGPADGGPADFGVSTDLGVPVDFAVPSDLGVPADGGLPDLGPLVAGVSPDGTGYCCEPRRWGNCGSPSFYRGGYASRTSDCLLSLTDTIWVPTTLEFVDAHGCVYLDLMTAMSCITPLDWGPADAGPVDAATIDSGP